MGSADGAFTPEVKEAILKRARLTCDRCGLRVERAHFHHRTPRRMGGTSRDDLGLPSNGLLLHPRCHDYIESKRVIAASLGFIVGYGSLPHEVPVMLWSGWTILNRDGTATRLDRPPPVGPWHPEPSSGAATPSEEEPGRERSPGDA